MHDGSVLWPAHYVWEEDQFTGWRSAGDRRPGSQEGLPHGSLLSISGSQALDTSTATGKLKLAVIGAAGQAEREAMLKR